MSSPVIVSSLLSSLPPRPPTPPREAQHAPLEPDRASLGLDSCSSIHTPPGFQSPTSSLVTTSTSQRQKRVGFSAHAEYKDPPIYPEGDSTKQHPTPASLPRSASKPVKSILKVTRYVPNPLESTNGETGNPSASHADLAVMLDSTLQQLAGGDRDTKIDAYMILTRALQASINVPDRDALQDKMSLFTQFIQRDITAKTPEGKLDTSLVHQAINLLSTFLHYPTIAYHISHDFAVFVIDHCIRSFGDASTPKDTVRRLLQLIYLQNFTAKVMTSDRVGRLISALHNIDERSKGKSIIKNRVTVYRKLVQQARQRMVVHSDWIKDMFTDMLSSISEIQSSAISLGLEAAFALGHEKLFPKKVMEVLNTFYEGRRYIEFYEEKLKTMSKDKHQSAAVPAIWSVVILLLRIPFDQWEFATNWLWIVQNCFNSADFPTKIAANHAWGRLVWLMQLEQRGFKRNLSTLTTPFVSQLKRRGPGKTSEELRRAVFSGICNLFYYAFKPGTPTPLLDTYWDNSVKPIVSKLLELAPTSADEYFTEACAILRGLFDYRRQRKWREDRIVEPSLVKADELPAIDARWIRSNPGRIMALVEPIIQRSFSDHFGSQGSAPSAVWNALLSAVAAASCKDIKPDRDTTLFINEALSVFRRIWDKGPELCSWGNQPAWEQFLTSAGQFLNTMFTSLGTLPFTERSGKQQAQSKTPLYTLFSVLSSPPPNLPDESMYAAMFSSTFGRFVESKAPRVRMDIARDLLSTIPMDAPRPYGPWLFAAQNVLSWLEYEEESNHSTTSSGLEPPIGNDFREVVRLLERGVRSTPNLPFDEWEKLFQAATARVRKETGDAGVNIVVVEPLAKMLREQISSLEPDTISTRYIQYVTQLESAAAQEQDAKAVNNARRRLWGTALAGSRSSTVDTLDHFYKLVNETLRRAYTAFSSEMSETIATLFRRLDNFLMTTHILLFPRAVFGFLDGIILWFQDSKRLVGSKGSNLHEYFYTVWDTFLHFVKQIPNREQQLQALEPFFCAVFNSTHLKIVNMGIEAWNLMFKDTKHLDYPEQLKSVLLGLQSRVDIVLPGIEPSSVSDAGQQQPMYVDSFDLSPPKLASTRSSRNASPQPPSSAIRSSPSIKLNLPIQSSPAGRVTRSQAKALQRRPRHDDSQVYFAPIESSDPGSPLDSQLLTEHQKEVRERQKEDALLFSEIRPSSPGTKRKEPADWTGSSQERSAATPEPDGAFDDYVSSTPTPRRGQPLPLLDSDMIDPPSSPPQPRPNPLKAEIRSRSICNSLLQEWQFSSSPVSGSPTPTRIIPGSNSQRDVANVPATDDDQPRLPVRPGNDDTKGETDSAAEEVIEESVILPSRSPKAPAKQVELPADEDLSIPRQSPLPDPARERDPTPMSDGREEYVDAPTSPSPSPKQTMKTSAASAAVEGPADNDKSFVSNPSFDISEADERSMLRLVVEIDSRNLNSAEYKRSSASLTGKGLAGNVGEVSPGCIVVRDETPKKSEVVKPVTKRARAGSTVAGVSEKEEDVPVSSQQPQSAQTRRGRPPKRKRAGSKADVAGATKRQKREGSEKRERVSAIQTAIVPSSDAEPQQQAVQSRAVEAKEPPSKEEERMPSSSADLSSSQGLSTKADHSQQEEEEEQQALALSPLTSSAADVLDIEGDDDFEVQSQIALETLTASQRQQQEEEEDEDEELPVEVPMALLTTTAQQGNQQQQVVAAGQEEEKKKPLTVGNQFQKMMELFRAGLDELRIARLSRQEVYQIEDLFMDMRRELYEAERRGRS